MTLLRGHIAILLIAALTLTGHSMAIARGMSSHASFMELCVGDSVVMMQVDENGEPTGVTHFCPDFSLILTTIVLPAVAVDAPSDVRVERALWAAEVFVFQRFHQGRNARAPPAIV